jgi:hypothetical protein
MTTFGKFSLSLAFLFALFPLSSHARTRNVTVDGLYAAAKSTVDDGKPSREELKKYPKLAAIVSPQLHKGYVTKVEVEALYSEHRARNISAFNALDKNHDGKVSYQEVVAGAPTLAKAFAYLDQGPKGYLTLNDFFSPRFIIQFTSVGSPGKSTPQDVPNLETLGAASPVSGSSDMALTQVEENALFADESPVVNGAGLEQLPEGVLTWDQWMENLSLGNAPRAKDGCPPGTPSEVQCIDTITIVGQRDPEPYPVLDPFMPLEPIVIIGSIDMGTKPSPESIVELIRKSSCMKSDEDCGVFSTRVLNECFRALGLIAGRDICRSLSADLLIACGNGQVSRC